MYIYFLIWYNVSMINTNYIRIGDKMNMPVIVMFLHLSFNVQYFKYLESLKLSVKDYYFRNIGK